MKDPKRIKKVLREIEKVWKKYPDLRLMQLIGNVWIEEQFESYYIKDKILVRYLKRYKEGEK